MRTGHAPGCVPTKQAAAQLGVAPSTLRAWVGRGLRPDPGTVRIGRRKERSYCPDWIRDTRRWMDDEP